MLAQRALLLAQIGRYAEASVAALDALNAGRTALAYEALAQAEEGRGHVPQAFQAARNGLNASPTPRERGRLEALLQRIQPR